MDGKDIRGYIQALPKVELHIHVEAIVSLASYHDLNLKNKVKPSLKAIPDYSSLFKIKSLKDMIANFLFLQTFFRSPDDFTYMVRDVESYCAANNIRYIELHVSPTMVLRGGYVSFEDFMSVVVKGFDELAASGGPDARIILDLSRSFGVENAHNNLSQLLKYLGRHPTKRVIGVGLGGQEKGNPCLPYAKVLAEARAAGLHVVVHAGEEVGPESVWEAVRDVGAERIGHGTSAMFDEALMDYLKERAIPLEVCPISNVATGKYVKSYSEHPIRTFIERGLFVTVNTDDPVLFDTDLNREYECLAESFEYGRDTVLSLLENGVRGSFLDEPGKKAQLKALRDAAAKLKKPASSRGKNAASA